MHRKRHIPPLGKTPTSVETPTSGAARPNLLIVGNPNVGKSVFFNAFTGHYAVVSNYPGTTVELMQGEALGAGVVSEGSGGPSPRGGRVPHPPPPPQGEEEAQCLNNKAAADSLSETGEAKGEEAQADEAERGEEGEEKGPPLSGFGKVVDTPGIYALCPLTEEERVSQRLLLEEDNSVLLHVVDAKNLHRALPLTLQLLELQKPMVLALNLYDEALAEGLQIDTQTLSQQLGIPTVTTVATEGVGMEALYAALEEARKTAEAQEAPLGEPVAAFSNKPCAQASPPRGGWGGGDTAPLGEPAAASSNKPCVQGSPPPFSMRYSEDIEAALATLTPLLAPAFGPQSRAVGLLLLQGDAALLSRLQQHHPEVGAAAQGALQSLRSGLSSKNTLLAVASLRYEAAFSLAETTSSPLPKKRKGFWEWLSRIAMAPATGIPLLLLMLYLGLYQFVGVFGAGVLVDFFEGQLFDGLLLPPFEALLRYVFGEAEGGAAWGGAWAAFWARELLGGEYGLVSLGLKYALAVILPIVASFFFFFSLLEDSGYFPRLALLADRAFKWLGLNGRAIIPLVLGVGCGTMATLVTRIQETRRERLITLVLLALAVPCSAQYGLISTLLVPEGGAFAFPTAFLWWGATVAFFFLLSGLLLSRLLPGESASFYMEIPPMRMPLLKNVAQKTLARLRWYFWEVLPIFLLASLLIWLGRLTGLFEALLALLAPVVEALGLPAATAEAFLFGFFRRDFGAAGLYALKESLSSAQTLVACVSLTLFLPCIAQFLMVKRERGWATALGIAFFVAAVALGAGKLTGSLLAWTGVVL